MYSNFYFLSRYGIQLHAYMISYRMHVCQSELQYLISTLPQRSIVRGVQVYLTLIVQATKHATNIRF